jgi:prevent-host-death family protein
MRKVTVREVQHNLADVLKWVEDGEEVEITRRDQVVARIVPATASSNRQNWPDFATRAASVWGKRPKGKPASAIIIDDRKDRL